ncbi:hypothetical protein B9G55_02995 [Saccharibacillus sp. O16]|nr:hypothetical protein B9G55_02995 [Saccharibacillus sp. O16]
MPKKTRKTCRGLLLTLFGLMIFGQAAEPVAAGERQDSYNYSAWGKAVPAPAAYEATQLINGSEFGGTAFKEPSDLQVAEDGRVYVLDSGNNRIVILDDKFKPLHVIDGFKREGQADGFENPQGFYVTEDGQMFIADTGHARVVHLDAKGELVKIVEKPQSELLAADFQFKPLKVVVDPSDRIYVMAEGVFDGFMEFGSDGVFTSFIGANRVEVDPAEYLWKRLATREQRSRMVMFTPTEFTGFDIDDEGFIYAASASRNGEPIKKLNAQGADILRRQGYYRPQGDMLYDNAKGPSRLIDIDVGDSDMYSVLDAKTGRVFTYNGDGYLLYVFGERGNRLGQFDTPVAIERSGERMLVLDRALGEITQFDVTAYGSTLNEATRSYYIGDEERAAELFQQTAALNANLDYAYAGIGKALLRQDDYAQSAEYFKRSMDKDGYSKAFLLHRKELMRQHFSWIMTTLLLGAAVLAVVHFARKRKGRAVYARIK